MTSETSMPGSLAGAGFRLPIPDRWRDPIHPNAPAVAADIARLYSLAEERRWRGPNDPNRDRRGDLRRTARTSQAMSSFDRYVKTAAIRDAVQGHELPGLGDRPEHFDYR